MPTKKEDDEIIIKDGETYIRIAYFFGIPVYKRIEVKRDSKPPISNEKTKILKSK